MTALSPEDQVREDKERENEEKRLAWWKRFRNIFWVAFLSAAILSSAWNWRVLPILTLVAIGTYLVVLIMMELGKTNKFFTIINEGQAKGITIFGRSDKCLMAFTAHRFNREIKPKKYLHDDAGWDIVHLASCARRPESKSWVKEFIRHVLFIDLGGLKWIGIWPLYKVYTYIFRWTTQRGQLPEKYSEQGSGQEMSFEEARTKTIDYILLQQVTYLLELKEVEDKDLIPVTIKVVWTIKIVNPFKALFRVHDWLETSSNRLRTYVRAGLGNLTWRQFQQEKNLLTLLGKDAEDIVKGIEDLYGPHTIGLEITELSVPDDFVKAAVQVRNAQAEAEAAIHKAEAVKIGAEAEKGRVTSVYADVKAQGEEGVAINLAEKLGDKTIIMGGPILEVIKGLVKKP